MSSLDRQRWRTRARLAAFELLYRHPALYWTASTFGFAGQWRRWQRLALDYVSGPRVLEVGSGPGWLLADLAAAGYRCSAIDQSPQMVRRATAHLTRRHLRADIRQASVQSLPFAEASFDTVVSTFPTDYIAEHQSLAEVARVLRPDGVFVIVLGASLLPTRLLVRPLVALQDAVYGGHPAASCSAAPSSTLVPALAAAALPARVECVNGPFWQAYLVVAQRAPANTPADDNAAATHTASNDGSPEAPAGDAGS